jgi:hypothetical protein
MNRSRVPSHVLRSVGYDSEAQVLEVEFKDGSLYRYFDVPSSTYEALMLAGSKGEYFYAEIKNAYRYKQAKDVSRFAHALSIFKGFFRREDENGRYRKIRL